MDSRLNSGFRLGNLVVMPIRGTIHGADGTNPLPRDCMAVLLELASSPGELVTYSDLTPVAGLDDDDEARECVERLKAALGDAGPNPRFIVESDAGATLVAPVREGIGDHTPDGRDEAKDEPLTFFEQLKRRKVIRVGAAYIVLAWVAIQVADVILPALAAPDWTITLTLALAMLGFPIAIVVAWLFEVTPGGTARDQRDRPASLTPKQRLTDVIVLSSLAVVVGYVAVNVLLDVRDERDRASLNLAPRMVTAASNTIAVMPFTHAGSPEQAYIGDGIAAETVRLLSRLRELKVAATTASFYFRDKNVDPQTIAEKLQVRHLLTGSVQVAGNRIVVNVTLVDAVTNLALWSEKYDRQMIDIFDIQSDIAREVAEASTDVLSDESEATLAFRPTNNLEAYDYYLRGWEYLRQPRTTDVLDNAQRLFHRALALDPDYALAHAGLCETHLAMYIRTKSVATVDDAQTACGAALELDPSLAEVHVALGYLAWHTGEFDEAEQRFRQAIAINSNAYEAYVGLSDTLFSKKDYDGAGLTLQQMIELQPGYWRGYYKLGHYYYRLGEDLKALPNFQRVTDLTPDNAPGWNNLGAVNYMLGNLEQAATAWQRAIDIEPTQSMYANLGTMYYYLERFDDAVEMQKKAIELAPNDFRMWGRMGAAYLQMNNREVEARAAFQQAIEYAQAILEVNPLEPDALKNIALFFARIGEPEAARSSIERALELTTGDPDTHFFAALTYLALGEQDRALRELEQAVAHGYPLTMIENEHALEDIKDTDRFRLLVSETAP